MILYCDIDLGQHRLSYWLVAWQHQAITWTNIDLSLVKFCGIHLRAISHRVGKLLFCVMRKLYLKITVTSPGVNELNMDLRYLCYHHNWRYHCDGCKPVCQKNISRYKAHTIVSWPNPEWWLIIHTSDLIVIISTHILTIITREMGKLKTHSLIHVYSIEGNWENWLNLRHTLNRIYLTSILYIQCLE